MADQDFLTAKIEQGFDQLDVSGNGVLTESDHVEMGRRMASSLGHAEGSPETERIVEAYLAIWREVHLPFVPTGMQGIPKEQFVASTRTLAENPEAARATLGKLAETYLAIADIDQDGRISPDEFLAFQRGHFPRLSEESAAEAFGHLDTDGDGVLSAAEFTTAVIEFWSSPDPDATGNWWMGRPAYL
ncbi:EF-hand domain-containing protein [Streptomyces lancefieldiae]|uniref:EF-hand domain-containing protein n=1 Tax=Streptomyces lancefieldiae TaxID=3075520 RepID=A0ABU3AFV2_9ACTN|nr:EF-hand domain-containing protein [Streptomyces sp. DSM 40712]MDT0609053.1 EF-hand domain-containing protein [Streptomyces sp. DSM 40712]